MLEVEADGLILRLTLARPAVRNALDEELIHLLLDQFTRLSDSVRAVVLTGQGSAFCAGGDLAWMRRGSEASEEDNFQDALQLAKLFEAISTCPAPVIARVNGHCFGGGCGFVAASDIAIAVDGALFAFSEVRLGLAPATIAPHVFRKMGRGAAAALFVTGETFDAETAMRLGLVNEVCPADELDRSVNQKLDWILKAGPRAIETVKSMVRSSDLSPAATAKLLASTRNGSEAREGIGAFLEKRTPSYAFERL
jgi:methylglutaconyl-CoA hydratase